MWQQSAARCYHQRVPKAPRGSLRLLVVAAGAVLFCGAGVAPLAEIVGLAVVGTDPVLACCTPDPNPNPDPNPDPNPNPNYPGPHPSPNPS